MENITPINVLCKMDVKNHDQNVYYFTKGKYYKAYEDRFGNYSIVTDKLFAKRYSSLAFNNIFTELKDCRNERIDSIIK